MGNRPRYICKKCGKLHKHFDSFLECCWVEND